MLIQIYLLKLISVGTDPFAVVALFDLKVALRYNSSFYYQNNGFYVCKTLKFKLLKATQLHGGLYKQAVSCTHIQRPALSKPDTTIIQTIHALFVLIVIILCM